MKTLPNRPVYFITGLMGCGKSTVSNILKYRHFEVINMDGFAKHLMLDESIKFKMIKYFGKEVINDEGQYNTDYVKSIYFLPEYDSKREEFEEEFDTLLGEALYEYFETVGNEGLPIFIEVPSFNTTRFERICNMFYGHLKAVINVGVDEQTRISRLVQNRGMTLDEIKLRGRLQSDLEDPNNKPKYVNTLIEIRNDGDMAKLYDTVRIVLELDNFFDKETKDKIFEHYLSRMPSYVKANMRCYVYYNSTGCGSCPCPCDNSEKHFEDTVKTWLDKHRGSNEKDN